MILAFIIAVASEFFGEIKETVRFIVVWIGSSFSGLGIAVLMGFIWPAQAVAISTRTAAINTILQYLLGGFLGILASKAARYFAKVPIRK